MRQGIRRSGFTLLELLVVIAIIALLISLLLPALSGSRQLGISAKCSSQLRTLGQGMTMYSQDNGDVMLPGRLPRVDNCTWFAKVEGGTKYRPTFLAMMGSNVGVRPFDFPAECRTVTDPFDQPGDRQDYSNPVFVCPATPERTDERNGSYGYNYQFLGNWRLSDSSDIYSFKNWPVIATRVRDTARTVAVADSMGTAATFAASERKTYENNGSAVTMYGNEGFNLDPPRIDLANGESAGFPDDWTGVEARHVRKCNVLWVDSHADPNSAAELGYHVEEDGRYIPDGNNGLWSGTGRDVAWTSGYRF